MDSIAASAESTNNKASLAADASPLPCIEEESALEQIPIGFKGDT